MNERSVFLEALEQVGPTQRSAYLDAACSGDAQLRLRVEALLKSHEEAGSFLGRLAPERLAEHLGLQETTGERRGETPANDDSQSLSFLDPSDTPGSLGRLGHYEVQEVIGRGGMGIVLGAFDEKLHRAVAIKVMTAPLAANENARRRFVREGRAAAAIRDDHVIGIHGVDETNGLPFLVMEYVAGRSLAQRLEADGPLPLADTLRIGGQIARGLAAAHAQGLVHRDIKPANILLENGVERVKITDFGLAHAVDDVRTTQLGVVIGTPEFMSPEQARGERVDHRCDLFSLGCVLYAMCAGRPPFRAENTVAILRRVCEDTPRPLSEINSEIPGWLIDVIDRLIAKDAGERFQSASEVGDLLEQFLAHVQQPTVIPKPASITKTRPARSQDALTGHRRWRIAAAAVLLLCAGLGLAESTGVTNVAGTVIRIVRGDGTLVVEIDDPNVQVLVDGEELVITGAGPKELRLRPGRHELNTVKDGKPVETKLITITRDGRQVVRVAREQPASSVTSNRLVWGDAVDKDGSVSPDGRYLAFTDWETGDLAVRDLATGNNRRLTNKGPWSASIEFAMLPRFSADGTQLAYTWYDKENKSELRVVGVGGGDPRAVYSNKNDKVFPVAWGWTPDGKAIVATFYFGGKPESSQLALISTADCPARVIKSFESRRRWDDWTALAPDGRTIAYSRNADPGTTHRDIFLIDVETGQETQVTAHVADKRVLGWTPDGQRLLYGMQRQDAWDAWLIRIVGGKPHGEAELAKKELGTIVPMGLTRGGTFYYGSSTRTPSLFTATLDLEKGTATAAPLAAEKFNYRDQLSLADWSPDGEHLAYRAQSSVIGQEMRIVSMKTGQTRVIKPDLRIWRRVRWSADGRSFVATSYSAHGSSSNEKQGIYQFDAVSGQAVAVVIEPPRAGQPVWSRDGRGIFYEKRAAGKSSIVYRDLQAQTERDALPPDSAVNDLKPSFAFEPSPDGRQLALLGAPSSESTALWLIPIDGAAPRELLKVNSPMSYDEGLAWTPDGRYVLFTRQDGQDNEKGLWYIASSGGEPRKLALTGMDAKKVTRLAVHPDGKHLALFAIESGKSDVWALENFLPPLADSTPAAAADASAAKSKSIASAANAPASAREQPAPAVPTTRQVWDEAVDFEFSGAASPDGKYLSFVDWTSGDLAVRDLAAGTNRRLTNQGWPEYPGSSVFSPDGQQVAFSVLNKDGVYELRLIGLDGSGQRVLVPNKDKEVRYLNVSDWSPDGKFILATFVKMDAGQHLSQIVLIAVEDGSSRVIKTLASNDPGRMILSPDGRFIAYSAYSQKTSRQRDILVLATDGSGEVPLVEHAADDRVLGWAPDGKRVVFASDRTGTFGIWMIAVAGGKPHGTPELVKPEMGQFHTLGLTRNGAYYYGLFSGGQNVYTATLDLEQGKLISPPAEAMQHGEGSNWSPAWSPDGRYLACLSHRQGRPPLFYIRSVESNEVRELAPNLRGFNVHSLHWSPNGQALLGAGSHEGEWGALQIDVQTGAVTTLIRGAGNGVFAPMLAPDGKTLFFKRSQGIIRRDLQTGVEQELCKPINRARWWTLSPDGQQLAFAEGGALKSTTRQPART